MMTTFWTDTTASGERRHTIWKPNDRWTSITYTSGINAEDRLIIEMAFNNLYSTSTWFQESCGIPKIGVFVRNGFHFSGDDILPHITFQFRGYVHDSLPSQYYHAYFDRTTKKITSISILSLSPITL